MASFINNIHVDEALSNLAVQYKNSEYIAARVFPGVKVNKKSGIYFVYDKANLFNRLSPLTNHNAAVGEASFNVSQADYDCQDFALRRFCSLDEIQQQDAPIDVLADSTETLTNILQLDREMALAALLFNTTTFSGTRLTDLSAGVKWSNPASEPINQILAARDSLIGVPGPYSIVFGLAAWTAFRTHPDVLASIQFAQGGIAVSEEQVKGFFGFEDVIIGEASVNTALPGQTPSYSRVWGDSVLIFKKSNTARVKDTALGYCMISRDLEVTRYPNYAPGVAGGEEVKVGWSYTDEIVCSDAGHLIFDVL